MKMDYLPISASDLEARGIKQLDFILVTGDAYVDHPSFGVAIIGRLLEAKGYQVGIIAQPNWKSTKDITALGKPKYGFMVTAGNLDSMVNHYTVSKKKRSTDVYTPGGFSGKRPDRATLVYCNLIKQVYKESPIVIGGLEASLRRLAHYDYWSDQVRRSVLLDAVGDLLIYGMAETTVLKVAESMAAGMHPKDLVDLPGTVRYAKTLEGLSDYVMLPDYKDIQKDKGAYAKSFKLQYENIDAHTAKILVEPYGGSGYVIQNPPAMPLSQEAFDQVYDLPYTYEVHPAYEALGGVKAIEEIKFSLTSNRGCYGGCHFCALAFHQGKAVQGRSHQSLIQEAKKMTQKPDFKGYIHDVGGPTANFRGPACEKQKTHGVCQHKACMTPDLCHQMVVDHQDYVRLLDALKDLPKVKKVFIRSGIRYDYVMADKNPSFMKTLVENHVSGQLRVAPEHVSKRVLDLMGKPKIDSYLTFQKRFNQLSEAAGLKQYVVPYLISSHPGSSLTEAIELAEFIKDQGIYPEQVQDFYPTPGTLSTCMYYTSINPLTMELVYVPTSKQEKAMQRALLQYKSKHNHHLVVQALTKAGREDLIGYHKNALVPPLGRGGSGPSKGAQGGQNQGGKTSQPPVGRTGKKKTIRNVHKKKK